MCFRNFKSIAMKRCKLLNLMNIVIKHPTIIMINRSINSLIRRLKIFHKILMILAVKMKKENKIFKLINNNMMIIKSTIKIWYLQMEQMKKICKVNLIQSFQSNTFKMNRNIPNNKVLKVKILVKFQNSTKADQQLDWSSQLFHRRDSSHKPANQIIKMLKLQLVKIYNELRTMKNLRKIISNKKIMKILKWNQMIMALEMKKTHNLIMIRMKM